MNRHKLPVGIIAFALGLGMGALIGIVFAPRSGEDTRGYLVGGAKDAVKNVADSSAGIAETARSVVNDAAARVLSAAEEGERAYAKAKNA